MRLDKNEPSIHGRSTNDSTVYISWKEDRWQQGDPLCEAIEDLHEGDSDPIQQAPMKPHAGEKRREPADLHKPDPPVLKSA